MDQKLEDLRHLYKNWRARHKVPTSYMAANRLFATKILKPKRGEYPSVSQKVMKGAASRMMVSFCADVSYDYALDTNAEHDW